LKYLIRSSLSTRKEHQNQATVQEHDQWDNYEVVGLFIIENAPCYFFCYFTDKEWVELAPKPPVPNEI